MENILVAAPTGTPVTLLKTVHNPKRSVLFSHSNIYSAVLVGGRTNVVTKLSRSDSKNRADQMSKTGTFLLSLGRAESYFFYSKSLRYTENSWIHVTQLWLLPTEIKQPGISYKLKKTNSLLSKHKGEEFVRGAQCAKVPLQVSAGLTQAGAAKLWDSATALGVKGAGPESLCANSWKSTRGN